MKQHRKKNVKGMTLIEIIIAIAVLGIAGLVMVKMGSVTKTIMFSTTHLVNKTEAEAPAASVRDVDALKEDDGSWTVVYQKDKNGNIVYQEDDAGNLVPVQIQVCTPTTIRVGDFATYNAARYSTAALGDNAERTYMNMQADLEFYRVGTAVTTP